MLKATLVVVVVSWNNRELLDSVLSSLARQDFDDVRVLVVDNGSDDGSQQYLDAEWPHVQTLALDRNVGFAAAVNAGVRATAGDFVGLVNTDVELGSTWASALVATLRGHAASGSATGKTLNARDPAVLDGTGDIVGWDGYCARRGRDERDVGQYDIPGPVFSVSGGASIYRREALERVGPFDPSFFAYIEDADWGFRAQLAGYDARYEPAAIAYHVGGASSARVPGFELFHCHRNMITMMLKCFPAEALILYFPLAATRRVGSFVRAVSSGQGLLVLRAWLAAARVVPRTLRARREIQKDRVRGWRSLRTLVPARAPLS